MAFVSLAMCIVLGIFIAIFQILLKTFSSWIWIAADERIRCFATVAAAAAALNMNVAIGSDALVGPAIWVVRWLVFAMVEWSLQTQLFFLQVMSIHSIVISLLSPFHCSTSSLVLRGNRISVPPIPPNVLTKFKRFYYLTFLIHLLTRLYSET